VAVNALQVGCSVLRAHAQPGFSRGTGQAGAVALVAEGCSLDELQRSDMHGAVGKKQSPLLLKTNISATALASAGLSTPPPPLYPSTNLEGDNGRDAKVGRQHNQHRWIMLACLHHPVQ